ncbi:hypothetical protein INS49_006047 [Diaporthe citri]|uniref:uncharacterized protein n=1 Tax=Diaporthe citri TaxID=83186 RepID=UPI001C7E7610|nr:uncharacterized protein INS49_006047 [Diaporthe citri]KAG6364446.1 hypothetical protein INS49_006047 [Diaporthe citri]
MPPLQSHIKQVDVLARREVPGNYGTSCSNNAWDCLNTPAQFGIIFSVVVVVIAIVWIYWYTVIRPRQERIKESGEDIELDLGDGRTRQVAVSEPVRLSVYRHWLTGTTRRKRKNEHTTMAVRKRAEETKCLDFQGNLCGPLPIKLRRPKLSQPRALRNEILKAVAREKKHVTLTTRAYPTLQDDESHSMSHLLKSWSPELGNRRDHEGMRPRLRSPSTAESSDDKGEKHSLKSSWGSKLASFLPTIARLATNNPVVQEVADNIADEPILVRDLPSASLTPASDAMLAARTRRALAREHHGSRGPPTTAIAATADARARFPRSHAKACSSPLSTPLSVSQKRLSSRHWTEPVAARQDRVATLMSCQAKMTDVVGGRAGAGKRSPSSRADDCTADARLEGHNRSGDDQKHMNQHQRNPISPRLAAFIPGRGPSRPWSQYYRARALISTI